MLLKYYGEPEIFGRIVRIMNSVPRFKPDEKSVFLVNLFKMHGIHVYWQTSHHNNNGNNRST